MESRRLRFGMIWVVCLVASLTFAASAFAAVYFGGYVGPGGARTTTCCNTRDADATWLAGYSGYIGLTTGVGWKALVQNGSGAGHVDTRTNVYAQCGNSSNVTYFMTCSSSVTP